MPVRLSLKDIEPGLHEGMRSAVMAAHEQIGPWAVERAGRGYVQADGSSPLASYFKALLSLGTAELALYTRVVSNPGSELQRAGLALATLCPGRIVQQVNRANGDMETALSVPSSHGDVHVRTLAKMRYGIPLEYAGVCPDDIVRADITIEAGEGRLVAAAVRNGSDNFGMFSRAPEGREEVNAADAYVLLAGSLVYVRQVLGDPSGHEEDGLAMELARQFLGPLPESFEEIDPSAAQRALRDEVPGILGLI